VNIKSPTKSTGKGRGGRSSVLRDMHSAHIAAESARMECKPKKAKASGLNRESIEGLASQLRRAFKPAYSGTEFAEHVTAALGGKISWKDFANDPDAGSIIVHGPRDFELFLPKHLAPTVDRFTIAHELGHYVLHFLWTNREAQDQPCPIYATRYGSDRAEREANWFALAFLLPEEEVAVEASRGKSAAEIAASFGVTTKLARARLIQLGLGLSNQSSPAMLSAHGEVEENGEHIEAGAGARPAAPAEAFS
jgi:hypothetical protein